jgi:hypothetical protein
VTPERSISTLDPGCPIRLRGLAPQSDPRSQGRSRHARRAPRRFWRVPRCQALAGARCSPPRRGTHESNGNETAKGAKRLMKAAGSGIEPECEPMEASVWTTYHPAAEQRRTSRGSAHQTDALERKPQLRRCSRRCFATRERPFLGSRSRHEPSGMPTLRRATSATAGSSSSSTLQAERIYSLLPPPSDSSRSIITRRKASFLHQPDMP